MGPKNDLILLKDLFSTQNVERRIHEFKQEMQVEFPGYKVYFGEQKGNSYYIEFINRNSMYEGIQIKLICPANYVACLEIFKVNLFGENEGIAYTRKVVSFILKLLIEENFNIVYANDDLAKYITADLEEKYKDKVFVIEGSNSILADIENAQNNVLFGLNLTENYHEKANSIITGVTDFFNEFKSQNKTFEAKKTKKFHPIVRSDKKCILVWDYYFLGHEGKIKILRDMEFTCVDESLFFKKEINNSENVADVLNEMMEELKDRRRLVNLVEPPMKFFSTLFAERVLFEFGINATIKNHIEACFRLLTTRYSAEIIEEMSYDLIENNQSVKCVRNESVLFFELFGSHFVLNVNQKDSLFMLDTMDEAHAKFIEMCTRIADERYQEAIRKINEATQNILRLGN